MFLRNFIALLALKAVLLVSASVFAAVEDDIAERIAPIGGVCMAGDACAAAVIEVASGPRSGEEIYNSKCLACHATGAAGAPKLGDVGAWAPRVAKGMDVLYSNAINGYNAMPAKGLCMDCSDEEINVTVDFMVENSK